MVDCVYHGSVSVGDENQNEFDKARLVVLCAGWALWNKSIKLPNLNIKSYEVHGVGGHAEFESEACQELDLIIAAMPAVFTRVIKLYFLYEQPMGEIADRLQCSKAHVSSLMTAALAWIDSRAKQIPSVVEAYNSIIISD